MINIYPMEWDDKVRDYPLTPVEIYKTLKDEWTDEELTQEKFGRELVRSYYKRVDKYLHAVSDYDSLPLHIGKAPVLDAAIERALRRGKSAYIKQEKRFQYEISDEAKEIGRLTRRYMMKVKRVVTSQEMSWIRREAKRHLADKVHNVSEKCRLTVWN